jgi:hypothetical protein
MCIKVGNAVGNVGFYFLKDLLEHLDVKLVEITDKIRNSVDPDADGLLDAGEYVVGMGFSTIQHYISCIYPRYEIKKSEALRLGEEVTNGVSCIKAINAGANYWKHQEEWGLEQCVSRDLDLLTKAARRTIETIELLTPWDDYTCSNLLALLVNEHDLKLSSLLPSIEAWRADLDQTYG